jgi:hypothetical protein
MKALIVLFVLTYDLIVLAGTTWLVVEHNWSMWTYLLALCFMFQIQKVNDGDHTRSETKK